MSKSIVIDFKRLESLKLSPNQYLYLVKLHRVGELYIKLSDAELLDLQAKKFVKIISDGTVTVVLRQSAIDLIKSLEIDSFGDMKKEKVLTKSERAIQEDLDAHLKEYRQLFKDTQVPGKMGGAGACKKKLFKWLKNNPEYDMLDVLRAARVYISSVDNYKYLQNAEYFISKTHDGVAHSNLSAFIEEDDEGDDDWTNELI